MVHKRLLRPERLRAVPRRFSWVDHRLVRERHLERCPSEALALYLFLVTVADAKGLSYFGDASVRARLGWGERQGRAARPGAPGADGGGFHRLRSPAVPGLSLDPAPSASETGSARTADRAVSPTCCAMPGHARDRLRDRRRQNDLANPATSNCWF